MKEIQRDTYVYLDKFKHDYETYYDDAFARAYGRGRNDGRVGYFGGSTTLILPNHPMDEDKPGRGGLRITRTIKAGGYSHILGQGGMKNPLPGSMINCSDLAGDNEKLNMDGIHWGGNATNHHHDSSIQNLGVYYAPRHGISNYLSGLGEFCWLDRVRCNSNGGNGLSLHQVRPLVPLHLGSLNLNGNGDAGMAIAGGIRTQVRIDFVSGDNNRSSLIRLERGTGRRTVTVNIGYIKAEIGKPNVMASIVDLQNGNGGFCLIDSIHMDCVIDPTHTDTYRAVNCTVGTPWRVYVGFFGKRDQTPAWSNELVFDDGNLQLTWEQMHGRSLDQRMPYRYLSWMGSGAQDGVEERLVSTPHFFLTISSHLNQRDKWPGKPVYDDHRGIPLYARSSAPDAAWHDSMGGLVYQPR